MAEVVVAGCARDCSKWITRCVKALQGELHPLFGRENITWIVVENGSKDDTRELLRNMSRRSASRWELLDAANMGDYGRDHRRTVRIAAGRNAILRRAEELELLEPGNFLVMADFDRVNTRIKGLATCFDWEEEWAGLFANQSRRYYDLWALRNADLPYDPWQLVRKRVEDGLSFRQARIRTFTPLIKLSYAKHRSLIPVESAFGGLGVYKAEWLKDRFYIGESKTGFHGMVCEHVFLHKSIVKDGGQLFINPLMVNQAP